MPQNDALRAVALEVIESLDLSGVFARGGPWADEVQEAARVCWEEEGGFTVVFAIGKAAPEMARGLMEQCGIRVDCGVCSTPYEAEGPLGDLIMFQGGHPVPNAESFEAGEEAARFLLGAGPSDLVIFLISGGGSACFERSISPEITLEEYQTLYGQLVTSGAGIAEINRVRNKLSAFKGGRMAIAASPSRQITLYVSDVPDGQDAAIASGPTMRDDSTVAEAIEILERFDLWEAAPDSIRDALKGRAKREVHEIVDGYFQRSTWHRLLSNGEALEAARRQCEARGWTSAIDTSTDEAPVAESAQFLVSKLRRRRALSEGPVCLIAGGEVRSRVTGDGSGGRNQAFVLACAPLIAGSEIAVMSIGTDGIDGNSPAAGAVADGTTLDRAATLGLDHAAFMAQSDSYSFFSQLNDAIETGPTGNNVRDLRILVAW